MQMNRVDFYIMINSKYLPADKMHIVRDRLISSDESRVAMLNAVQYKDPTAMLLVSVFLGGLGIDRFMIGDIGMGILKLLTFGLCGILVVIDWFLIQSKTREKNFSLLMLNI